MTRQEIPTLTIRREAATVFPLDRADAVLTEAREAFPGYALEIETISDGDIVITTTAAMPVARWLRY